MHRTRRATPLVGATLALLLVQPSALAGGPGGASSSATTARVSVASDGTQGNGASFLPAVSADGRYVAFESLASTLVPGDTNGMRDIFVHDRLTDATERVSVSTSGAEANNHSFEPAISADGRFVAWHSAASNLAPGITNGVADIFVHDRQTGFTERVSVASDGTQANGPSGRPSLSADGRYVAFDSEASNLVPFDTNGWSDIFVHDRQTGTTDRVSVAFSGMQGNHFSVWASISGDGRWVAFQSFASNLVPDDTNFVQDIFVRDRQMGTTERVSLGVGGAQANNSSFIPAISADGRFVAFESDATNLVPGDTNGARDIFVRDRQAGATERVSVGFDGSQANNWSFAVSISANGSHVVFQSAASNLVPGDTNSAPDIFLRVRETGTTERVSVGADGAQGNGGSLRPAVSAGGRFVAFDSAASNLVPGDTNGVGDVFVRDRGAPPPEATLAYTGPVSAIRGSDVTLSATLRTDEGAAIAGRAVRFAMEGFEAEVEADQEGVARVETTILQSYGTQTLTVSFDGDENFDPIEITVPFEVAWEHRFADGEAELRLNTITRDLQFAAPGDESGVKTDPGMTVQTLPTGDTLIGVQYTDEDLTVVGRFLPERTTFVALVATESGIYPLAGTP